MNAIIDYTMYLKALSDMMISSTNLPGGNQVDGLPPVSNLVLVLTSVLSSSCPHGAEHSLSILILSLGWGRGNMSSRPCDVLGCGHDLTHARPPSLELHLKFCL